MAQLTGDALGGGAGKSILNMISGGIGYIIMGSSHLITLLRDMAEKNTIKNAINTLTQGGNVGSAQRLQQVLTDAKVQNTEITAMRLSVDDYTAFAREASYRGLLFAGNLGMDDGAILFPQYQSSQVTSIIKDLHLNVLEKATSTREINKAVKAMDALDIKENPELAKFAKIGDDRPEPVPIDQFDFGKADTGMVFTYDLDETGMPKAGSGNPMTGKTFERGDIFYHNGKIDAKTGTFVSGVRFQFDGEKFIKSTALPTDSIGILKDTIRFYSPEQYAFLTNLKGDKFRQALTALIKSPHPNNFNRKEKAGQTETELRDIMRCSDASTYRSLSSQNITEADVLLAARADIRACVVYTPWDNFPELKPFSKFSDPYESKSKSASYAMNVDSGEAERNVKTIEKLIAKELAVNPEFYKCIRPDIAANPDLIRLAVTAHFDNWQNIPDSVLLSITGVNKNAALADYYKRMVEQYINTDPSKTEYVTLDDEGFARPNIAFLDKIPAPFLQLFKKDELLTAAVGLGQKYDNLIKTGKENLPFAPAKTSYAEEAKQAIEHAFSQHAQNEAVITKQSFFPPSPIKKAKKHLPSVDDEQMKQLTNDMTKGLEQ